MKPSTIHRHSRPSFQHGMATRQRKERMPHGWLYMEIMGTDSKRPRLADCITAQDCVLRRARRDETAESATLLHLSRGAMHDSTCTASRASRCGTLLQRSWLPSPDSALTSQLNSFIERRGCGCVRNQVRTDTRHSMRNTGSISRTCCSSLVARCAGYDGKSPFCSSASTSVYYIVSARPQVLNLKDGAANYRMDL
jgi:hypothetical protein